MKEYTSAALLVLALSLAAAAWRGIWRDSTLWLGLGFFAALTVAADVVLTGIGVYGYDRRFTAGVYLGRMPLEDLAYGIALYLTAAVTWTWGERRDC